VVGSNRVIASPNLNQFAEPAGNGDDTTSAIRRTAEPPPAPVVGWSPDERVVLRSQYEFVESADANAYFQTLVSFSAR